MPALSSRAQGYLFALAAPICWSVGGVVMRTVDAGAWDIVFWRAVGHAVCFPFVMVIFLGIDPKQADQNVRGSVALPKGIGKSKRVVAFCQDALVKDALAAGAIKAGVEPAQAADLSALEAISSTGSPPAGKWIC
jgi:hypothetical protein